MRTRTFAGAVTAGVALPSSRLGRNRGASDGVRILAGQLNSGGALASTRVLTDREKRAEVSGCLVKSRNQHKCQL